MGWALWVVQGWTRCAGTARQRCCSISLFGSSASFVGWLETARRDMQLSARGGRHLRSRGRRSQGERSAQNEIAGRLRWVGDAGAACLRVRSKGSQKAEKKSDQSSAAGRAVNEAGLDGCEPRLDETVGSRQARIGLAIWLLRAKLRPRIAQLKRGRMGAPIARRTGNGASIAGFQFRFHRLHLPHLGLLARLPRSTAQSGREPPGASDARGPTGRGARRGAERGAGRGSPA